MYILYLGNGTYPISFVLQCLLSNEHFQGDIILVRWKGVVQRITEARDGTRLVLESTSPRVFGALSRGTQAMRRSISLGQTSLEHRYLQIVQAQ